MTMMIAKRAPQHTTMLQEPSFPQSFTLIDFPTSTVLLWHGDATRRRGVPGAYWPAGAVALAHPSSSAMYSI